ncbi:hypothetical protein HY250_01705 [Candidatus Azambacteria bacterium]|nr:hypothetical protein [Candidatus Azambacteria bacterium]MBI3685095.1 hypothetical protein [Candidatus Azambacteria bacterium]
MPKKFESPKIESDPTHLEGDVAWSEGEDTGNGIQAKAKDGKKFEEIDEETKKKMNEWDKNLKDRHEQE